MIRKVLVANRGEIAVRIIRTLDELGIGSVAVVSEADRSAPHAMAADEVALLGPAPAAESYLRAEAVLAAAKEHGCDAIHPGYGFLSESAAFAEACEAAGIRFVGPPPSAMRAMGDKTASRDAMQAAGVPVVPGFQDPQADDAAFAKAARKLGYPVMVKASAGGGGKGMRAVQEPGELASALSLARSEAKAGFGDDRVYLEKLIVRPRHVEIQIFADHTGRTFHLGERECSVQRRHQKILEESPSPAVDAALREKMGAAAVAAARAVDYRNAGTVEFLLDDSGSFYFLEMNTRLQVEHPVTEAVYGVDLVAAQIAAAAGQPLPFDPADLAPRGHAIEARVYAEDAAQGFLPQTGTVRELTEPQHPGVRVDSGLRRGSEVTVHYDPLLAKVTAWGTDRAAATRRLRAALREMVVLGVVTNIDFLTDVLALPAWEKGKLHTGFLDEHLPQWSAGAIPPEALAVAAAALAAPRTGGATAGPGTAARPTPWTTLGGWRPLGDG